MPGGGEQIPAPPFIPPEYAEYATTQVGTDPLSQLTRAGLDRMLQTGGVAPTPIAGEIEGTLQDLLQRRGRQDQPLSPEEEQTRGTLTGMIGEQGGEAPTTELGTQVRRRLGADVTGGGERQLTQFETQTQSGLADIMANRGKVPPSELAQSASTQLQQIMAAGGDRPLTGMEQDTANQLRSIIQSGGALPEGELGQQVESNIQRLLETGGALPGQDQQRAMGIEAARAPLDVMRRAQLAQGEAALAARGMLGSGAGREYGERLEERLAPQYTAAAQQLERDRLQREEARYGQALGLGAQRAGQQESLQQQRLTGALGQAGQVSAQQAQEQRQALQAATGQAGDISGQEAERQQRALSGALGQSAQVSAQREQARDTRLSQATDQARTMTAQESADRQERYLTALQTQTGISRDEAVQRDNRLQQAMGLATGMSQAQSQNLLNTAQTVTERQQMMADIGMRSLGQNMEWNRFLAEFNLERTEVMERIAQGRIDSLLPLLQQYMGVAGAAAQGYAYSE